MLFDLVQRVQCCKNHFKFFLPQEAGAFGNNSKGTAKTTSKIGKLCILYLYREYLLRLQSNVIGSCLQNCINFIEQRLKFSHFKGSIIPKSNIGLQTSY